jgi:hypothetical protein
MKAMSRVETLSRLHPSHSGAARRTGRHRYFVGAPIGSRTGSAASSGKLAARMMIAFAFAAAVLLGRLPVQAQQFSAELIAGNAAGGTVGSPGKIFVADRKVRIETSDFPNSFLIVDSNVPAAYLVRQRLRVFMDAKQSSRLTRLFVAPGGLDPCSQWRTMAEVAGIIIGDGGQWRCEAAETESLDGRASRKFRITSPSDHATAWIDGQLNFPVKFELDDGAVLTLRNIQEGAQPPETFEVPGNFKKFNQQLFLERLKRTDIWVEP